MASTKTYYIFRHGETFYTKYRRGIYGFRIRSAHIIDEGKPVIQKIAEFLKDIKSEHHATSAYTRCIETSEIITEITGKKFVVDKRLNEFLFETFGHLRRRLHRFITEMEDSDYQTILICTHGACISGLTMLLTHGEYRASELMNFPPPGVLLKIHNGKVEKWDFNETK